MRSLEEWGSDVGSGVDTPCGKCQSYSQQMIWLSFDRGRRHT